MKILVMTAALGALAPSGLAADVEPRESSCSIGTDKSVPVRVAAGRVAYCALDLGSRSVKLSVVSLEPGRNATIKDERQCKRTLGLGAFVFDSKTRTASPLPEARIDHLAETVREYKGLCKLDGGTMLGAFATQWARDATNIDNVRAKLRQKTGLDFDVLTPKQEADYGYLAATLGAPGRLVLDPGSNSFEIAWKPKHASAISSVIIEHGYVRASVMDFEPAADYATATQSYASGVKARIDGELARLSPATSLAGLRKLIRSGELEPEILAFGQDGAVALSVRGSLRDSRGSWIADPKVYDAAVAGQTPKPDARFGFVVGEPMTPAEIDAFVAGTTAEDFRVLAADPVKSLYGQKALVIPILVNLLLKELGAAKLVMLPQELSTGFIIAKSEHSRQLGRPR